MVNIDVLLSEWAYRCKKGYPDLDSPSDLRILKSILKEQNISLPLTEDREATKNVPNTKEINSYEELMKLIDKLNLPPNTIKKISAMVLGLGDNLDEEDLTNKIVDNKDDLKDQIDYSDLNSEQIQQLSSRLLAFEKEKEIKDYFLKKGGKAMVQDQVFEVLFDSMIKSGDVLKFSEYIKTPEGFKSIFPSEKGSLIDPFKNIFDDNFLYKMVALDGAYGGISIGKGEFYLCLMCEDITFEGESEGDLDWGGKGLEIKNKGAKPTGQKASYGPNSHQLIFKNLFKFFKGLIVKYNPDPSQYGYQRTKKKFISIKDIRGQKGFMDLANVQWPYKIKAYYDEILSKDLYSGENDKVKKEFIDVFGSGFKEAYKGLGDANVMNIDQYFSDSEFDADKFTLDWGIAVVEDYMENEGFDYVLFVNDKTFKYHLFERDNIINKLTLDKGKESYIYISPKDGLPRWSATYTLFD